MESGAQCKKCNNTFEKIKNIFFIKAVSCYNHIMEFFSYKVVELSAKIVNKFEQRNYIKAISCDLTLWKMFPVYIKFYGNINIKRIAER